ncbi:hypothetical protein SUGI_0318390 [Cryptomeria japonica]|nr:hypothetical protein SUGI_0318390 [Cryptomeria japonica]
MSEARSSRIRSCVKLPELPDEIIVEIGEKLSLKDVANLTSCCRGMASQAKQFYEQRRRVDMSCFESVTPSICNHLITLFSRTRLAGLHFCYDVHRRHKYDEETLHAILGFFSFSFSTHSDIDLYTGTPRLVDILAHGYFLHKFLSSQQQLRRLEVDKERKYVRGGGEKEKALLTLDIVGRKCPGLEIYWPSSHLASPPHVITAFLKGCPRVTFANFHFMLGIEQLDTYAATLTSPLELASAHFYFTGWDGLPEQERRVNEAKLRFLGSRLHKISAVHVIFDARGCMEDCMELVKAMPTIKTLAFLRYFRQMERPVAPVFAQAFSLLRQLRRAPLVVLLNGVPEEEFEKLVDINSWNVLPTGVEHLRIIFHWRSPIFDQGKQDLVNKFMQTAPLHLQTCSVFGVRKLFSEDYVFLKTFNRGKVAIKTVLLPFTRIFGIEKMPC